MSVTFGYVLEKLKDDLDLEEDKNAFITDEDILQYLNESIHRAESIIHNIFEDYFLSQTNLTMTSGSQIVALPSDIFASKIRKLFYFPSNISQRYEVIRIRDKNKLMDVRDNDFYQYQLMNDATNGEHIELSPAARETSTNLKLLYIRNAKQFATDGTEDSQLIDIPEFHRFILQDSKANIMEKDGDPRLPETLQRLNAYEQEMTSTLTRRIDDEDDLIRQDLSFYLDASLPDTGNDYYNY
jgi:hypothetical protein